MTTTEARARLRQLGRKVTRLKNGRFLVKGCWPDVRECDLPQVAYTFEKQLERHSGG
jgi:hypothetical protein